MLALLLACTTPDEEGTDTEDSTPVEVAGPPAPPAYSEGTCPALVEGSQTFRSAGKDRDVIVKLPANPEGAPVWFAWHWLGGTAKQAVKYQELEDKVVAAGYIVVAPDSCCGTFEWPFLPDEDPTPDLTLFDDLRSCLYEQYEVDLTRVYSNGMSAGALWTTYLTMHRGDVLAATAPFSGGTGTLIDWTPPARQIPVLVTWGGPEDLYAAFSFEDASTAFVEQLQGHGAWVGQCVHDGGHSLPPGGTDYALRFFEDHAWGVDPEPYAEGLPGDPFPEWCSIP